MRLVHFYVGKNIYNALIGFGLKVQMYDNLKNETLDYNNATSFIITEPNIIISIDFRIDTVHFKYGFDEKKHVDKETESVEKIKKLVKLLVQRSLLIFDYEVFHKEISIGGERKID